MRITLVALNCRYTHSCLALFYVRNELMARLPDAEITFCQFTINDPYYDTLLRISGTRPEAVFFSVYIWNHAYAGRLVNDLAGIMPEMRIVLGGPQVTYGGGMELPPLATIVRGEIEGVPEGFYADLRTRNLEAVYTASKGNTFRFPYADHDFAVNLQNRHVYYESSRGCPFSCSYCLSAAESSVRHKDIGQVKKELRIILRQRPKTVRFVDRTFNANPKRTLELWRFLAESAKETSFHFEIAPDRFNEEMFSFLEAMEPGVFQFEIGLQSTHPEALQAVDRIIDLEASLDNITRLVTLDTVHLHVDMILGLPFETKETCKKSFNDIFALGPHYIQMGLLKVLPGTPLSRREDEFGLVRCQLPPYEVLATRWMDHETIGHLYEFGETVEAFYNNGLFKTVFSYVRDNGLDPFSFFKRLQEICRKHGFFEKGRNQETIMRMLLAATAEQHDNSLFRELLRFDYLRLGHKSIPQCIQEADLYEARDFLWHHLPQNYPPFFSYKNRNEFFKHALFSKFSRRALQATGFDSKTDGYVVFLPEDSRKTPGRRKPVSLPLMGERRK